MRTPQRLAWLGIADGTLAAVLVWRSVSGDGPHHLIDTATALTLLAGVLDAAPAALRSLTCTHEPTPQDVERRDALLLFPSEGEDAADVAKPQSPLPSERTPWLTILAYSVLMLALMWRWAVLGKPYAVLGAVTMSTLMLGFLRAAVITLESLRRASVPPASPLRNEPPDALLLFPAEDSSADDLDLAPRMLATGRKALL